MAAGRSHSASPSPPSPSSLRRRHEGELRFKTVGRHAHDGNRCTVHGADAMDESGLRAGGMPRSYVLGAGDCVCILASAIEGKHISGDDGK